MSLSCVLYLSAFVCGVASAMGKCPGWVVGILLSVAGLLMCFPR